MMPAKPKPAFAQLLDRVLSPDSPFTSTERFVAVTVARRFGKKDYCWPSIKDIVGCTDLGRTAVRKALDVLCDGPDAVFFRRRGGSEPGGRRRETQYRLRPAAENASVGPSDRVTTRPGQKATGSPRATTGSPGAHDRVATRPRIDEYVNEPVQLTVQQQNPDPLPLPFSPRPDERSVNALGSELARLHVQLRNYPDFRRIRRTMRNRLRSGETFEQLRGEAVAKAQERTRAEEEQNAIETRACRRFAIAGTCVDFVLAHPHLTYDEAATAWARDFVGDRDDLESALSLAPYVLRQRQAQREKAQNELSSKEAAYG